MLNKLKTSITREYQTLAASNLISQGKLRTPLVRCCRVYALNGLFPGRCMSRCVKHPQTAGIGLRENTVNCILI